jgi:prepilin-type N-terminal cleavage/methylation domain-containing protein
MFAPEKTRERNGKHLRGRGFSLIELLVVIAIILIIAAIAVKIAANQASAAEGV